MLTGLEMSYRIQRALSTMRSAAPERLREVVVERVTSVPPENIHQMAQAIWDAWPPARPAFIEMRIAAMLRVARALALPDAVHLLQRAAAEALKPDHALTWSTLREVESLDPPDTLRDNLAGTIRWLDQIRPMLPGADEAKP
jgi:hypothetical protein